MESQPPIPQAALDLEVKDPHLIFESVWRDLQGEIGEENMSFPREIFWLNGAPGAGKGTQTELIRQYKDISAPVVAVSALLTSPEAKRLINAGRMASDKEATYLVLKQLLAPEYHMGAVVDGFPRTGVQVEVLKLFYERMKELRAKMHHRSDYETRFPKPRFRIIVLYVDEAESIKRQVARGQKTLAHNEQVEKTGMGQKIEVRATDLDPETARRRYKTFKEVTYESLKSLRNVFDYHFVDAQGSVEEVRQRIEEELSYQSSLELEPATYDRISHIPISTDVLRHARQELAQRLDNYARHHTATFDQVIALIESSIMPALRRQALTGLVIIPITSHLMTDELAQGMLVDVFSERGYRATVYDWSRHIPAQVDLATGHITTKKEPTFRVEIRFQNYGVRR